MIFDVYRNKIVFIVELIAALFISILNLCNITFEAFVEQKMYYYF